MARDARAAASDSRLRDQGSDLLEKYNGRGARCTLSTLWTTAFLSVRVMPLSFCNGGERQTLRSGRSHDRTPVLLSAPHKSLRPASREEADRFAYLPEAGNCALRGPGKAIG